MFYLSSLAIHKSSIHFMTSPGLDSFSAMKKKEVLVEWPSSLTAAKQRLKGSGPELYRRWLASCLCALYVCQHENVLPKNLNCYVKKDNMNMRHVQTVCKIAHGIEEWSATCTQNLGA